MGAGDTVRAEVSRLLAGLIRQGDVLARYGGDEFLLLLPGSDAAAAAEVPIGSGSVAPRAPHGMAAWPAWARFAFDQAVLRVLALAVAGLSAGPLRPWSLRRARRRAVRGRAAKGRGSGGAGDG